MSFINKATITFSFLLLLLFFNIPKIHEAKSANSSFPCTEKMALEWPVGITKDKSGNIYLAQGLVYNTIGKIDSSGRYSILAGSPNEAGFKDDIGGNARFNGPSDLVVDSNGEYLYVTDYYNHLIRRVRTANGETTTIAGVAGKPGLINGAGGNNTVTQFYNPSGIGIDKNNNLYIADSTNSVIRKITPAPNYEVSTMAGNGARDWKDGAIDQASFAFPEDIAIDENNGTLYVTENKNQTIRAISFKNGVGSVSTLATVFGIPHGVAVDNTGLVYFSDSLSQTIGTVTRGGVVNTIAGTSKSAGNTDGDGTTAKLNQPLGMFVESADKIYVTDFQNKSIRMIEGNVNPITNKKTYQVSTLNVCPVLVESVPASENIGKR